MGQYYKPVSVPKKEYVYSHSYGNGLKLMEHSYIENTFVKVVEGFLIPGGRWYKDSIVWAGDYADGEDNDTKPNLHEICDLEVHGDPETFDRKKYRYLCNHTKKEFVDYEELAPDAVKDEEDPFGEREEKFVINPLPLLTCEGNGRGGGDFHKEEDERVGSWARDSISIEETAPEGYKQINGKFVE